MTAAGDKTNAKICELGKGYELLISLVAKRASPAPILTQHQLKIALRTHRDWVQKSQKTFRRVRTKKEIVKAWQQKNTCLKRPNWKGVQEHG